MEGCIQTPHSLTQVGRCVCVCGGVCLCVCSTFLKKKKSPWIIFFCDFLTGWVSGRHGDEVSQPITVLADVVIIYFSFMNYGLDASQMFTKSNSFNCDDFKIRINSWYDYMKQQKPFSWTQVWMHLSSLSSVSCPYRLFLLWFLWFVWLFCF